jgi:hypothetical protein
MVNSITANVYTLVTNYKERNGRHRYPADSNRYNGNKGTPCDFKTIKEAFCYIKKIHLNGKVCTQT